MPFGARSSPNLVSVAPAVSTVTTIVVVLAALAASVVPTMAMSVWTDLGVATGRSDCGDERADAEQSREPTREKTGHDWRLLMEGRDACS